MSEKDILDQKLPSKWDAVQNGFLHLAVMFGIMLLIWNLDKGKSIIVAAFGRHIYEVSTGYLLIAFAACAGAATFKTLKLFIELKQKFKITKTDD